MSKNAEPNNFPIELAGLSGTLENICCGHTAVVLARVVNNFSPQRWQELRTAGALEGWQVLPLSEPESAPAPESAALPVSPFREVYGALERKTFGQLLARELIRLDRNGGCLSLVGAALQGQKELEDEVGNQMLGQLQAILGLTILHQMSACDTLGILRKGQFVCSLPGFGQLAARGFAEKCQQDFAHAAAALLAPLGKEAVCALGIVNVLQGEHPAAKALLNRTKSSLEVALARDGNHIYQETSHTPLENTTLVHSSEKRFLFFGEEAS